MNQIYALRFQFHMNQKITEFMKPKKKSAGFLW